MRPPKEPRKDRRRQSDSSSQQHAEPPSEATGTTISQLPIDIIDKIFHLCSNKDLSNCMKVNRYWFQHVAGGIGLKLQIGSHPVTPGFPVPATVRSNELQKVGKIPTVGVNLGWFQGNFSSQKNLSFKYSYLVKRLILDCKISTENFKTLVTPLALLTELSLSQLSLLTMSLKEIGDGQLTLPNLKTMVISGHSLAWPTATNSKERYLYRYLFGSPEPLISQPKWKQMILNVRFILSRLAFPSINEIVLQSFSVTSTKQEDIIMEELVNFLGRHKKTLRKLSIFICNTRRAQGVNSRLTTPINHDTLKASVENLKLESIFIRNSRYSSTTPRMQTQLENCLDNFASSEWAKDKLKHLVWCFKSKQTGTGFFNPFPLIANNTGSLVSAELKLSPRLRNINCEYFKNCGSLKFLKLISEPRAWEYEDDDGIPTFLDPKLRIISFDSLPPNLEELCIAGIAIPTAGTQHLTNLTKLKALELMDTGNQNAFGLDLATFKQIVNNKCIGKIRVRNGLNKTNIAGFEKIAFDLVIGNYGDIILMLVEGEYKQGLLALVQGDNGIDFRAERSKYFKNGATSIHYEDDDESIWRMLTNLDYNTYEIVHHDETETNHLYRYRYNNYTTAPKTLTFVEEDLHVSDSEDESDQTEEESTDGESDLEDDPDSDSQEDSSSSSSDETEESDSA